MIMIYKLSLAISCLASNCGYYELSTFGNKSTYLTVNALKP